MNKKIPSKKKRSDTARIIADKFKVTPTYVRMVMRNERENEAIYKAYISYEKRKNSLLKEFKSLLKVKA